MNSLMGVVSISLSVNRPVKLGKLAVCVLNRHQECLCPGGDAAAIRKMHMSKHGNHRILQSVFIWPMETQTCVSQINFKLYQFMVSVEKDKLVPELTH